MTEHDYEIAPTARFAIVEHPAAGRTIEAGDHLQYLIRPRPEADVVRFAGCAVSVDIVFADGGMLSASGATDQNGFVAEPEAQGKSSTVYPGQWNYRRIDLAAHVGRTIQTLGVRFGLHERPADHVAVGTLANVSVGVPASYSSPPAWADGDEPTPADFVLTTRGSNSTFEYSRGNCFPATAVPRGVNHYGPVTNADALDWTYEYFQGESASAPPIQGFAASHLPTPWIGDRNVVRIMPTAATSSAVLPSDRESRFDHTSERARPYSYEVALEDGMVVRIAPTSTAALFAVTFPGPGARFIVEVPEEGHHRLTQSGRTILVETTGASSASAGVPNFYAVLEFADDIVVTSTDAAHRVVVQLRAASAGEEVVVRFGSSFVSHAAAADNLAREIAPGRSVEQVAAAARDQWNGLLGRVQVPTATDAQKVSLYSSVYRMFLFPSAMHELDATGQVVHPNLSATPPGSTHSGGPLYVNNGFWDTYRTVWPAYALLDPHGAEELVEGLVSHYRDAGWMPRWASPAAVDIMVGTSSDVIFADLHQRGVRVDTSHALLASIKNATVVSTESSVGRKGARWSMYLGYTPSEITEGLSWTMENCLADFALAAWIEEVLATEQDAPQRERLAAYQQYLLRRSTSFHHLFDPDSGFFRGKTRQGALREVEGGFDPLEWGFDYTETNAFNMAFSAPHDAHALVALHGGDAGYLAKLTELFTEAEVSPNTGSYGRVIHEMSEARDVRLGAVGMSNQPSHHLPFMFAYAGRPDIGHGYTATILRSLFTGSEIGQGYPGDEDNGEMSAWFVLASVGIYPLTVGSPYWLLTPPLFDDVSIRSGDHTTRISTTGRAGPDAQLQTVLVDGQPWRSAAIDHQTLTRAASIVFVFGDEPSEWGRDPASLVGVSRRGADPVLPYRDAAIAPAVFRDAGGTALAQLTDDDALGGSHSLAPGEAWGIDLGEPRHIEMYTLTSQRSATAPRAWIVEGSDDTVTWRVLDERDEEEFLWDLQLVPFAVAHPFPARHIRVTNTHPDHDFELSQIELLEGTRP
ncbi:GH92 family glycosyl hydrolase [uncultured Microbacterium sp.]|uniref:GH92 family glycosyl hydrolase n=1 Tax=uncultured Microbacterium sp. TaxID=191216 RepID=UPI0035CC3093